VGAALKIAGTQRLAASHSVPRPDVRHNAESCFSSCCARIGGPDNAVLALGLILSDSCSALQAGPLAWPIPVTQYRTWLVRIEFSQSHPGGIRALIRATDLPSWVVCDFCIGLQGWLPRSLSPGAYVRFWIPCRRGSSSLKPRSCQRGEEKRARNATGTFTGTTLQNGAIARLTLGRLRAGEKPVK